jgi:hypothetical protein
MITVNPFPIHKLKKHSELFKIFKKRLHHAVSFLLRNAFQKTKIRTFTDFIKNNIILPLKIFDLKNKK